MEQQKPQVNSGGGLTIAGVVVSLGSFVMDTTVNNYALGSATHNLGLMQTQMMVLHVGLAMFLGGLIQSIRIVPTSAANAANAVVEDTDEQREAREDRHARNVKATWIIFGVIAAIVVLMMVLANLGSSADSDVNMMNVDTTMNAEEIDGAMKADANMTVPDDMMLSNDINAPN